MTDKELNSHDLAREIEIVKLQEENEELKSILRGTTHCFDEEEHNKLKEEIRQLKKHLKVPKTYNLKTLEDYKSYYEDTTREQILEDTYIEYCAYVNLAHRYSELKKQLHEASLTIQEMTEQDIECPSNCEKLRQLKKQLEEKENIACDWKDSCLENAGKIEILETQQKEFIKYLKDTIKKEQKNLDDLCDIYKVPKENNSTYKFLCSFVHRIEKILSKYNEIIEGKND